jgi:hypothetical protein
MDVAGYAETTTLSEAKSTAGVAKTGKFALSAKEGVAVCRLKSRLTSRLFPQQGLLSCPDLPETKRQAAVKRTSSYHRKYKALQFLKQDAKRTATERW